MFFLFVLILFDLNSYHLQVQKVPGMLFRNLLRVIYINNLLLLVVLLVNLLKVFVFISLLTVQMTWLPRDAIQKTFHLQNTAFWTW